MNKATLGTFAENMSNANQIEETYTALSTHCATMQQAYLSAKNVHGADHATTQTLWDLYLAADEEAQPYRVAMGQIQMQEQRDAGATPVNVD